MFYAAKHAHASEVRLTAEPRDADLHITIADDGCGFSENGATGNGLANMRGRAADLGGKCTITSELGRGTTVALSLPWPPNHG